MARPQQDAIDTFISITGTTETQALQKLEAHGGDLNEAVNAFYNERDRVNLGTSPIRNAHDNFVDLEDSMDVDAVTPPFPNLTSEGRRMVPFPPHYPINDQSFSNGLGSAEFIRREPWVSHPREVREIPIDFKDGSNHSGSSMNTEDIISSAGEHGAEVSETIVVDDDDDDLTAHHAAVDVGNCLGFHATNPGTSAPRIDTISDPNNDIEEEMIRAAIKASMQEAEGHQSEPKPPITEDPKLAVSLSSERAKDKTPQDQRMLTEHKGSSSISGSFSEMQKKMIASNGRQELHQLDNGASTRSSSDEEAEDAEEQPLMRRRSHTIPPGTDVPAADFESSNNLLIRPESQDHRTQPNGLFHSDEWGGISSEEHDEAVMLEAAMFGVPERPVYNYPYPLRVPRSTSPTLTAQRLLREQQDDEYLAALQADREKDLKAEQEEVAAREAALEKEKVLKEEASRKLHEKEEFERELSAKQASLPHEPALDDENAVTLLIRMPDGSRHGRRFLKSDKLQSLFNFIDIGRVVTPGTYRLVRPYPRRAFGEAEQNLSFSDLGLTSKQEALFIELL